MNAAFSWILVMSFVQVIAPRMNPKGHQRGRLFTMPLRRHFPKIFDNLACRFIQIMFLVVFNIAAQFTVKGHDAAISISFSIAIIVLYLDDWLTNHDDLKKKWDLVRNKIKWKMKLPEPAPAGSKVG